MLLVHSFMLIVIVSHFPSMENATRKRETFRFVPDEMHIEIVGGTFKRHYHGDDLTLDAFSLSEDTSYAPDEDAFEGNLAFWVSNPPLKDPNLSIIEGMYTVIPSSALNYPITYNFTINVTRTKIPGYYDTKTAWQTVYVLRKRDPEFSVKCVRNCKNANPYDMTTLIAVCKKHCQNVRYEWTVTPPVPEYFIDFGTGYKKIVIYAGVFSTGDVIKVEASSAGISKSYTIKYIDYMIKGDCEINPKRGISTVTLFRVNCSGFRPKGEYMDHMVYQHSNHSQGAVLISAKLKSDIHEVFLGKGSPTWLLVVAQDYDYIQSEFYMKVMVDPIPGTENVDDKLKILKRIVLSEDKDCLKYLSETNQTNFVIQKSNIVLDELSTIPNLDPDLKKYLYKHIVLALRQVPPFTFDHAVQTISILTKLNEYKTVPDSFLMRILSEIVLQCSIAVHNSVRHLTRNIPFLYMRNFFSKILKLLGSLIEVKPHLLAILNEHVPKHDYDSYDDVVSEKVKIRYDFSEIIKNVLMSMKIMGPCVIYLHLPGQTALIYELDLLTYITKRINPFQLYTHIIGFTNRLQNYVRFSRYFAESLTLKFDFIDYQFTAFQNNVLWWHLGSADIHTDLLMFDLVRLFEDVSTVENTYQINLVMRNVPVGSLEGTVEIGEYSHVYRLHTSEVGLLLFSFRNVVTPYYVAYSNCFCSEDDFLNGVEVSPNVSDEENMIQLSPPKHRNSLYVCIKKKDPGMSINYIILYSSFTCVHWDLERGQWDHDKCKVQMAFLQSERHLKCLCNHASLFGGKIFVAPNSLTVTYDININVLLLKNWVMVLIISTMLALWVLLSFFGYKEDKKFKKKNFICVLDDNYPGDGHVYIMVIFTGAFIDAGTSADVAFQVFGSLSNSRVHLLKCANVKLLRRNSQDWVIFYTPELLGDIYKMRIWHNCKGINPHWYCSRIIIQHLKSGTQYTFEIQKWFSLIWDGGQIYRKVFPEKEEDYKSAKFLMMVKLRTQIKEKHLWVSILARDPQSNFKSVERVACAFAFLFLSMLVSAMFYGLPKGKPSDFIEEKEALKHFRFQLMIIIESFLISFPISFIILKIFQHSSPPDIIDEDEDDEDELLAYQSKSQDEREEEKHK